MCTWLRRTGMALAIFCALVLTAWSASAADALAAPVRYPAGAVHSPMTRGVVDRLREVLARSGGRRDVFIKVGDSNTVNPAFLGCFARKDVRLGAHAALAPTLDFFRSHIVDGRRTSFDRVTEAARVGWLAGAVLAGERAPLEREIAALRPAFAVVMLGTNDNRPGGIEPFTKNLAEVVDRALALGVVPLVSTIPPRTDSPAAAARVAELNAVVRSLAEERQVPLMDLHAALLPLRGRGLAADGVHLQVAGKDSPHGCWFTRDALSRGMNVRNLVTLTALDRARRFLLDGEAPEPDPVEAVAMASR